jgi:CubicO group peptidase (beta-lactamase class C family)
MHFTKLLFFVIFPLVSFLSLAIMPANVSAQSPIASGVSTISNKNQEKDDCSFSPYIKVDSLMKPEEIRGLLQKIVDGKRAKGIAIGYVTPAGRCVMGVGDSGNAARAQIDGETIFELGSITKGLTGTLLADMVAKGELKLDEPIGPNLPKEAQGNAALAAITFKQLTTHTSGLSRIPMTIAFAKAGLLNPLDPYANYSEADFIKDLANIAPKKEASFAYSNTGVALLGMLLADRAGKPYADLVRERLLAPLGMNATTMGAAKENDPLAAQPHDTKLKPTPAWNLGVFAPTGAARSNVNDMMKLIDANLARNPPWLAAHEQLIPQGKVRGVAHNWFLARLLSSFDGKEKRDTLVWHNGGTFGSASFVGFDVERGIGVVVLINTGALGLADEIGLHLWDRRMPEPAFAPKTPSIGLIGAALIGTVAFASVSLATRAYATFVAASTPTPQTSKPSRGWSSFTSLFSKPFADRIDTLLTAIYAMASVLCITVFVPAVKLTLGITLHHLFYIAIAISLVYALWITRKMKWWVGGDVKRWLSIVFHGLLSALFFAIASR